MIMKTEIDQQPGTVIDRINDAIRDNPLAAGFIGAGLAWMIFGTRGFGAIAGAAKEATGKATSAAVDAGSSLSQGLRKVATTAASTARDVASSVGEQATAMVSDVNAADGEKSTDTLNSAASVVRENVRSTLSSGGEFGQALKSRLSEGLERQPLLLGAIGLVIGAGIASTFATTEIESQWLAPHGEAARGVLKGAVEEAKNRSREVVAAVQSEATRQSLTMDDAAKAVSTVADKVKNVAGSAKDAVHKPFGLKS